MNIQRSDTLPFAIFAIRANSEQCKFDTLETQRTRLLVHFSMRKQLFLITNAGGKLLSNATVRQATVMETAG